MAKFLLVTLATTLFLGFTPLALIQGCAAFRSKVFQDLFMERSLTSPCPFQITHTHKLWAVTRASRCVRARSSRTGSCTGYSLQKLDSYQSKARPSAGLLVSALSHSGSFGHSNSQHSLKPDLRNRIHHGISCYNHSPAYTARRELQTSTPVLMLGVL